MRLRYICRIFNIQFNFNQMSTCSGHEYVWGLWSWTSRERYIKLYMYHI